jgi:radical SAM protein with 4Fe4S-binding SPASM domain
MRSLKEGGFTLNKLYDFIARPITFWLTVNRSCNFRCKWCYAENSQYDLSQNMTLDIATSIVDLAISSGVSNVLLIGGEPTFWKHLFDFNLYCKDKNIGVSLVTNACRFGDDRFWNEYLQFSCKGIGVSVKGVSENHFTKIVGAKTLYKQTLLGIERAMKLYPNAGVSTVFSNLITTKDLREIARESKRLGAKSILVSLCTAIMDKDKPNDQFMVSGERLAVDIIEVYPYLNGLFDGNVCFELNMPLCLWQEDFIDQLIERRQLVSTCHVQDRSGVVFDTNGDILPCNSMLEFSIGRYGVDFNDAESLKQHLNSQALCDQYAELLRYPSSVCEECRINHLCRGGCIINWTVLNPALCCGFKP